MNGNIAAHRKEKTMRTIEEILGDIAACERCANRKNECVQTLNYDCSTCDAIYSANIYEYRKELGEAILRDIPIPRAIEICNAEREGRGDGGTKEAVREPGRL